MIEAKRTYRFQDRFVAEGLFWREEYLVGRIRDADFLADVGGITAGCGGLAAFGVDALERGDRDENTCSAVTDYLDQQPRDRIGVWGRRVSRRFASDAATPEKPQNAVAIMSSVADETARAALCMEGSS